jgi:excinuclease UvrABC helicase subunit UvrB
MPPFEIKSEFRPAGDQPVAIEQLVSAVKGGDPHTTLLGATGTGKTFTIAHVVEALQRPTLVIAPNKSLGAQLANEFREVFPTTRSSTSSATTTTTNPRPTSRPPTPTSRRTAR